VRMAIPQMSNKGLARQILAPIGLSNMDYTSVASFLLKLNGNNTF
jgi:hypothetical protein